MNLLVVTSLTKTFGNNEKIIFAGNWIQSKINFKKDLKKRNYKFFKNTNHHDQKYKEYILDLRERLINDLVSQLNKIHKLNYAHKIWKILLEPWLTMYLENNYHRWNLILKIIKKNKKLKFIYLKNLENFETNFDSKEFKMLIGRSDIYNQYIFQKILKYMKKTYKKKIYFFNSFTKINKNYQKLHITKKSALGRFRSFINLFLYFFIKRNKFYLDIYFSGYKNLILNLKLKQLPYKDSIFFSNENYLKLLKRKKTNSSLRKKISFKSLKSIAFENYLSENLKNDLPTAVLENFSLIKKHANLIPLKPKIIVSDINYQHNIIFKFWLINCIKNKTKFFIADHGGAFIHRSKKANAYGAIIDNHDEEISDLVIRWHKPLNQNNIQLPALKISRFKEIRSNYQNLKHLLMIGFETTKYPRYFLTVPISGQTLYQVQYIKSLYKNLKSNLKNHFLFKPFPKNIMGGGWNIDNRTQFLFSQEKLITNYKGAIKKAKIIICSYPSTTFLESMISGPTILLYKSEYWKYTKDFNNLLSNLKEANILFENPNLAAKHLNKVWDNVDSWWESKKVKSVRSQFFSEACQIRENSINMWKDFLISQEDKYYNKKIDINY